MSEQRKALVAKLVDAADSKSAGFKPVPVRVRPRAPSVNNEDVNLRFFVFQWKIKNGVATVLTFTSIKNKLANNQNT